MKHEMTSYFSAVIRVGGLLQMLPSVVMLDIRKRDLGSSESISIEWPRVNPTWESIHIEKKNVFRLKI